eukprot:136724-Pelagomonas_calceolata.AAC.1
MEGESSSAAASRRGGGGPPGQRMNAGQHRSNFMCRNLQTVPSTEPNLLFRRSQNQKNTVLTV